MFASIIESHGEYSPVSEIAVNSNSNISGIAVVQNDEHYTVVSIEDTQGTTCLFFLARKDAAPARRHKVEVGGQHYQWAGPYKVVDLN